MFYSLSDGTDPKVLSKTSMDLGGMSAGCERPVLQDCSFLPQSNCAKKRVKSLQIGQHRYYYFTVEESEVQQGHTVYI